ncbi:MAG: hypothetical protein DRP26_05680 [Candidatus Zixiibacteriota bacterium]|nr:MAG: hypothetical protein DRP26_05680 [candidate division Zixibacteria bacterium]
MFAYIVFFVIAFGSALCVIVLSSKHNFNSLAGWSGSLLMLVGAALFYGAINIIINLIANIIFTVGAVVFLVGMYKLVLSTGRMKTDQSAHLQEKTISDILQVASARESLLELLNYSLDRFLEVFSLNSGTIHIYHRPKSVLLMGAYRGLSPLHAKRLELIKPGETAIGRAVQNKRVLIIRDMRVSPDYQFFGGKAEGYSFLAVVPIMVNSDCWGVITLLGRKKYHRGMLDVGLLERFGLKLGQALVLGRENRKITVAFNRLRNIIEFYNRLFENIETSWKTGNLWHKEAVYKMLDDYRGKLVAGKPYCIFEISSGSCICIYQQAPQGLDVGYNEHGFTERMDFKSLLSGFKKDEFFEVKSQEIAHLIPPGFFKNEILTGYGFNYGDNEIEIILIDENREIVVKNYNDDIILIKNFITLMQVITDIKNSQKLISKDQTTDDEVAKVSQNLSKILTGISKDIQLLLEQSSKEDIPIKNDDFIDRLQSVRQTALKGMELINKENPQYDTNTVIQSALNSENLNVSFYPGSKLPVIKTGMDDFKNTVVEIVKQAIKNNRARGGYRPIKLRLSGQNQSIVLTLEGNINPDFLSTDLTEKAKNHGLGINILGHDDSTEKSVSYDESKFESGDDLKILVIEDKPVLKELLVDLFSKIGYTIKAVSSGNEGLAFIKSARNSAEAIDVVIIDMALEDIAGLELCKKIKQFDSSIHTVIISSWGVNFYTSTLNEAGVDAVLHKPFRLEQLSQILPGPKKRDEQKYK